MRTPTPLLASILLVGGCASPGNEAYQPTRELTASIPAELAQEQIRRAVELTSTNGYVSANGRTELALGSVEFSEDGFVLTHVCTEGPLKRYVGERIDVDVRYGVTTYGAWRRPPRLEVYAEEETYIDRGEGREAWPDGFVLFQFHESEEDEFLKTLEALESLGVKRDN